MIGKNIITPKLGIYQNEKSKLKRLALAEYYAKMNLVQLPEEITFHDIDHTFDPEKGVVNMTNTYSQIEGLPDYLRELGIISAAFHDTGLIQPGRDDSGNPIIKIVYDGHEERSAELAQRALTDLGYKPRDIQIVQDTINATKVGSIPKTDLQKIICDADTDNLGRKDFFEKTYDLAKELGMDYHNPDNSDIENKITELEWLRGKDPEIEGGTLGFLKSRPTYTRAAIRLGRDAQKQKNIQETQQRIHKLEYELGLGHKY